MKCLYISALIIIIFIYRARTTTRVFTRPLIHFSKLKLLDTNFQFTKYENDNYKDTIMRLINKTIKCIFVLQKFKINL